MKKTLTLLSAIMLYFTGIKAQSCATAQNLSTYVNGSSLPQTTKEKWYYFSAMYQDIFLDVLNKDTTFHWVDSLFIYGNSCGSLSLLKSYGRPAGYGNVNGLETRVQGLTIGTTYYIKVKLSLTPPFTVKYALNLARATAAACDLIVNGDFEDISPYSCVPASTNVACVPGVLVIPSWESGGHGTPFISTYSCPIMYNPPPHSGFTSCLLICGGIQYNGITGLYSPADAHAYARTTLATPLTAGQNYYVQMFYQYDWTNPLVTLPCDGLGMYLSAGSPTMNYASGPPNYYCSVSISPTLAPQFQNPVGNVIANTTWLPMGGVYTPAISGVDHITIGNFRPSTATTFSSSPLWGGSAYMIDDVSITPLTLTVAPVPAICAGMTTQLNPNSCTPPYCTATYTWLPATGLGSPNSLNTSASPSVTTTYTLTRLITNATGSVVATNSAQITVTVTPGTFTFSAGATSQVICSNLGQSAVTLTAGSTASPTYVWYPGALLGPMQPISPSASIVYTVEASIGNCVFTKTVSVTVSSLCCTSTVGVITAANIIGTDIYGPAVINQDLTITGNAISRFRDGTFLIAPGVKITVLGGSQLELKGVHLYACTNTMWQGIDIKMNGRVLSLPTSSNTTLIEDAITAINIENITGVPTLSLTELNGAIFNKNYVAISISNATTNAVPNFMMSNVFTSRTLTFTATQWPKATDSYPGLRAAVNPSTGLAPPYTLQSAPISNLKNPYSGQPGHIGVKLLNVGNVSGLPAFGIDLGQSVGILYLNNFNLFDALGYGIYAENANVNSINNVFQNTQQYTTINGLQGGDAIFHACYTQMNTRLDLRDPLGINITSSGNRFWDCHRAVNGSNTMQFYATYGVYRSRQASTAGNGFWPGNTGIYISSSRFEYLITDNTFNNLRYAINIPIVAGLNNIGGMQAGIYAGYMIMLNNYFGAQTSSSLALSSNEYMNKAISVSSPNNTGWQSPYGLGLSIQSNNMNRVYRGVTVNGMNGAYTSISSNSVNLVTDVMTGGTQRGIELVNTLNNSTILTNTLVATGLSNTLTTLVYSGLNVGTGSPSVCCNILGNAYKGFEFNSNNLATVWKGNIMNNLGKGMVLSTNGLIGQQGSPGKPTDNQWISFAGGSNGTWTEAGSLASSSFLWVNSLGGTWYPPNNNGAFFNQSYGYTSPSNIGSTTGSYVCAAPGNPPPALMMAPPVESEETSIDMLYSSSTGLYRYLDENPSQMIGNDTLTEFYDSLALSSVGTFKQVEEKLFAGQPAQASSLNTAVTPYNNVEWNYKLYYQLYDRYSSNSFSAIDSSALYNLAGLCPGSDGPCVYQARALYNLI